MLRYHDITTERECLNMIDERLLTQEESAIYALRALYRNRGYLPFKMSRFEEYEYYLRNKDFLNSDRIISFTDVGGRLMALKPDVTLSIIKNGEDIPGYIQRVCYDERVYRPAGAGREFREIAQTGIECIGQLGDYELYEVLLLAAESLRILSPEYVLNVSHLGILSALLEGCGTGEGFRREVERLLSEKNLHELRALCRRFEVAPAEEERLLRCAALNCPLPEAVKELRGLGCDESALRELDSLSLLLEAGGYARHIRFDFSVVNNMHYYSGIVFTGYIEGVHGTLLSGGRYDNLMRQLGRSADAIGFALYLNRLEELRTGSGENDADMLLLYDEKTGIGKLAAAAERLRGEGKSFSVQRELPSGLRFGGILDLREGAASC